MQRVTINLIIVSVVLKLYSPKAIEYYYYSGRFSDLLILCAPFPYRLRRYSGLWVLHKDFDWAYSSGSVQDLHLIPFSPHISKQCWEVWHQNSVTKVGIILTKQHSFRNYIILVDMKKIILLKIKKLQNKTHFSFNYMTSLSDG